MVASFVQPLNIFLLGLGGGFLMPLAARLGARASGAVFWLALGGIALVAALAFAAVLQGGEPFEVLTAGAVPPIAINLRFGWWEGLFAAPVSLVALAGALPLWRRFRGHYGALTLYLLLVMGLNGLIMTRDLFNLFVFLEIVSIATYGLLAFGAGGRALAAGFKYIMATVVASTLILLGTALLYNVTGSLNIDNLIDARVAITGPVGFTGLMMLLAGLLLEMKPFPANGWALDVYETAPAGLGALMSAGVSAGLFFAILKLLPLFAGYETLIAVAAGVTFIGANLAGLAQRNVQRMLGSSSIGQMALGLFALVLLVQNDEIAALPLVVGGLFLNHLLAKAGLFWLAGLVGREQAGDWNGLSRRPLLLLAFAALVIAISGLPPFPGFFAKWQLVMLLAGEGHGLAIAVVLAGSMLEATYMARWFLRALQDGEAPDLRGAGAVHALPLALALGLLAAAGAGAALLAGADLTRLAVPLLAGLFLAALDPLPGRLKGLVMLGLVAAGSVWLVRDVEGLPRLFDIVIASGGGVLAIASLYRGDRRSGYHALLAVLLLGIVAAVASLTSLDFFLQWEVVTLASFFLIARKPSAGPAALTFLLFSLASAFFVLAGFAFAFAANGTLQLAALGLAGPESVIAFVLLAIGFLIKLAAFGVHIWLPAAHSAAEDDFSAMLSAVVTKLAVFGLLAAAYLAIRSSAGLNAAYLMAWIGLATTFAGALMALAQDDAKKLLAYSSMSQLGYIITAVGLMSHIGWVTTLYLTATHLMVKGTLFLAVAGIGLRAGSRSLPALGGLGRAMPVTAATTILALIAMSGLPPLAGFGGKWLLIAAMIDRGWWDMAIAALIATFIGFLYMGQMALGLFFGPRRGAAAEAGGLREAPLALLVPQVVLVAGILLLSYFPQPLMAPVAAAIDPRFAAGLVWQGMSLEDIYAYWRAGPTIVMVVTVALGLLVLALAVYRRSGGGRAPAVAGMMPFFAFWRTRARRITPSVAIFCWSGVGTAALALSGAVRRLYRGNGQIDALLTVLYFLVLWFAAIIAGLPGQAAGG